ncbi:MAG: hypothetical protein P9L92_03790 [Candidatus Electryonea clarkiae]|nr:hypothetical protein [Candidatus Electryonea clarkiae]MDP8286938.1 hypothetical protein [Candidatus Electryonea clarkiae]
MNIFSVPQGRKKTSELQLSPALGLEDFVYQSKPLAYARGYMLSLLCSLSLNNQNKKNTPLKASNKKYNDSQDYQASFFAPLRLCAKNKLFQNIYGLENSTDVCDIVFTAEYTKQAQS